MPNVGIRPFIPLGSGWRLSNVGNHWDHDAFKGWTIIRNSDGRYNIIFDNRCVSVDFYTLSEAVEAGDVVVKVLNKESDLQLNYYRVFAGRTEYIAFDCLNKCLGYFLAQNRDDALKLVKSNYPKATWFRESEGSGRDYINRGGKYVPAFGRR